MTGLPNADPGLIANLDYLLLWASGASMVGWKKEKNNKINLKSLSPSLSFRCNLQAIKNALRACSSDGYFGYSVSKFLKCKYSAPL